MGTPDTVLLWAPISKRLSSYSLYGTTVATTRDALHDPLPQGDLRAVCCGVREFSGFLIFLTIVLNFEEEIYRYTIEHPLTDRDYAWIILIFFGLIDLFLTWAIYHRLKTIQIK